MMSRRKSPAWWHSWWAPAAGQCHAPSSHGGGPLLNTCSADLHMLTWPLCCKGWQLQQHLVSFDQQATEDILQLIWTHRGPSDRWSLSAAFGSPCRSSSQRWTSAGSGESRTRQWQGFASGLFAYLWTLRGYLKLTHFGFPIWTTGANDFGRTLNHVPAKSHPHTQWQLRRGLDACSHRTSCARRTASCPKSPAHSQLAKESRSHADTMFSGHLQVHRCSPSQGKALPERSLPTWWSRLGVAKDIAVALALPDHLEEMLFSRHRPTTAKFQSCHQKEYHSYRQGRWHRGQNSDCRVGVAASRWRVHRSGSRQPIATTLHLARKASAPFDLSL